MNQNFLKCWPYARPSGDR